ncbi:MAG: glutamate--cysteine ligase [Hyphomicrobiales bacterium]
MSGPSPDTLEARQPVESKAQLVSYLEQGAKPAEDWRIGTEHEKFVFQKDTLRPVPYAGDRSIRALLQGLKDRFAWAPVVENDNLIALSDGLKSISLEPGGQFELSGAPFTTLHETRQEIREHLDQVHAVGNDLGLGFLGLGFTPTWTRADVPVMPKGRYGIMAPYMDRKGTLGRDMMFRTCTVQVNLDFSSEADMVKKMRVALALQPVATALFAASPFTEGKPNGYQTFRSAVWLDTDPDRSGMLPFAFEPGFGFERYVDYALDVPMYFVARNGGYVNVAGESFRAFMQGKLPQLPGERPTMKDWADHLTTIFPEVRLKRYLEMRGADAGPLAHLEALPALWTGLLYDAQALDEAAEVTRGWSEDDRQTLRRSVPKLALDAPLGKRTVRPVAMEILEIARNGLARRGKLDDQGNDESQYLAPLEEIAVTGRTYAQALLDRYATTWGGDIRRIYADAAL